MTFKQFLDKWNGKPCEIYDPSSKDQCVDLVLAWLQALGLGHLIPLGIFNAFDMWKLPKLVPYFDFIPNTPDAIPQEGDIVVWGSSYGKYGHVGIATGRGTLRTFSAFVQNDPIGTKSHVIENYSYNGVLGWLRIKNSSNTNMTNLEKKAAWWFDLMNAVIWKKTREEMTDEMVQSWIKDYPGQRRRSGWYDKLVHYIKDRTNIDTNLVSSDALIKVIASWKGLNTQLQEALAEIKNRDEQVSRLKTQLLNSEKFYKEQLQALETCRKQLQIKQQEIDTTFARVGQLEKDLARCQSGQEIARDNLITKVVNFIKALWPV